ncbi:acetyltransferase (GNAT) family protein [Tumebacillus sp. BK434]|uniref:GNAT family N-acetyltransferase n=1 Tax=Tumebacillus sp. BK434 TaxID=2512169 RepID=UPI001045117A|nr:GNAT family N-acetyltransferase [Tumebacillus sp. BK434]TCP56038.1 acetyltransferase (GNAT) family protein [Tumebacillus sp. BK434]
MITFRLVQPDADRATLVQFFTDISEAEQAEGDLQFNEEDYIQFAKQKAADLPEGFVLMEDDGHTVGELVLRRAEYEGREVGYISFIYVVPEGRGQGYSQQLLRYAEDLFRKLQFPEYHLRVAQTNARAIRFYEKNGFEQLAQETNSLQQLCWRMGKRLK